MQINLSPLHAERNTETLKQEGITTVHLHDHRKTEMNVHHFHHVHLGHVCTSDQRAALHHLRGLDLRVLCDAHQLIQITVSSDLMFQVPTMFLLTNQLKATCENSVLAARRRGGRQDGREAQERTVSKARILVYDVEDEVSWEAPQMTLSETSAVRRPR